ncbi:MAG: tetrathionate reductase family octaheme c-type cytochrome [Thermodesulfobacteriota bacterium]
MGGAFLLGWVMVGVLGLGAQALAHAHKDMIKGPFKSPQEITSTCLGCHEKQAKDFMATVHWSWSRTQEIPGKGKRDLGKKNAVNNFCIALPSNWPRCTSCHAGYGWKDASFDFSKAENVDCLVCHDTSGTYKKTPTGAGMPDPGVDLEKVAQSVGKTSRATCGSCHFFGGGGDHIKHGDLDTSLVAPPKAIDVHMAVDGKNMTCSSCHKTKDHVIPGMALSVSAKGEATLSCTNCHTETPHKNAILNRHFERVACQTCHIPIFARSLPTMVWWDWSKAGQDVKEPPKDQWGQKLYHKMKGESKWAKDVVPTYLWFNGSTERYLLGDPIQDPSKVLHLNLPLGSKEDKNAKIWPFKVMRGKQPYDAGNKLLGVPHLFGGYWKHYDWGQALATGMAAAGLPYSGKYDWIETDMFWRVTHMVAPKDQALRCTDCHGPKGRLDWKALGYEKDPQKKS